MKKLFIVLVVLAAIYAAVKLSIKSPDQAIPSAVEEQNGMNGAPTEPESFSPAGGTVTKEDTITADRIKVAFTGYGPGGKVENGSVQAKESSLKRNGNIFSGSVVFDMNTITSTPIKEMLITHLKSDAFFDVAKHPTATFTITSATEAQVKGNLTMKGITKAVTLPLSFNPATSTYSSTVRVNMEDFGIKQTFTDKEFVLTVTVK